MRIAQGFLLALCLVSLTAQAQTGSGPYTRAGKWESTVGLYLTGSESASGINNSSIDIDTGAGLGFSAGYNFTQNFALRFDGAWSRADYDAVLDTDAQGLLDISHRLSAFTGQVNGVWNILDGAFTPYLQAGFGWSYIDSNVSDGPPVTGCWWDPWWGYICSDFYSTYDETNFSWNFGAGLRYEFNNRMFVRGGWEQLNIDGGKGVDPSFDAFRLELGWIF
ncbi:MAG: porin family protein [Wenzhouxiangellaceae bacterium]|nr:porin family protein [Wenzhouxiangellaceae bacterium]